MHTPSTPHLEPSTHTQPSVPSPAAAPRTRRSPLRQALPALLVACSSIIIGGSLLGVGGCGAGGASPAVRVGQIASAHSRAASRLASLGPSGGERASADGDPSGALAANSPASPSASSPLAPRAASASTHAVRETATSPGAAAQKPDADSRLDLDAPLRIKRLVVARNVEAREPVDAAKTFSSAEAGRIFAFVEVDNPERAESEIVVTFEPVNGDPTGHVRLRVGASPRWRTWAFTRAANTPGAWQAVVRNANGDVLASAPFSIES